MKDYSFGNYICALRMGLGLSQFQLGTLVGVTDKAVSKWENGDAKPRIATCYRLAEVLGVSIDELLSCKQYITAPARKELEIMKHTLWKEAYRRLAIYGDAPPVACLSRLAAEEAALRRTDAIHGFGALSRIREALKQHGSAMIVAGPVNSSYAAWLLGATNVNPLEPHYHCPQCGNVAFVPDMADGFDLPQKKCRCGAQYIRDGHRLPFEGYAGTAQLGICLEIRISEGAFPIAVQALTGFYEGKAELLPVMYDCSNIVQYVVLSENKPKPPVSEDGYWHTDADEFWQWLENETTFTFGPSESLGKLEQIMSRSHTPWPDPVSLMTPKMAEALYLQRYNQFSFLSKALDKEKAHDFDLLLQIDGLNHSTGGWTENGEHLVTQAVASLRELPATREDIWNDISAALTAHNIADRGLALSVMEKTRKGLFCSQGMDPVIQNTLQALDLPPWYPEYLAKCRYLFPKGHCIAHLLINALTQWGESTQK